MYHTSILMLPCGVEIQTNNRHKKRYMALHKRNCPYCKDMGDILEIDDDIIINTIQHDDSYEVNRYNQLRKRYHKEEDHKTRLALLLYS